MERQALTRPDLESTITGENEHLLSREDESGQHGSLQQFSRHVDQSSPDVCTETHELQQWRSTIKNTQIDETQILLEAETEDAGLTSPLAQESNVNKPQQEEVYQVASTHSEQNNTTPQDYDINTSTRLQCIIGVFTGYLLALACIGSGIYVLATKKEKLAMHVNIDETAREVLSLVFNIILTFCIDSMAFVHSVSLRWALYSEHQLEFNTNLRLFTSSSKSGPNRWYANFFGMICLILCYGASSYLLLPRGVNKVFINGFALLILGLALLGHASLSTWCLWTSSDSVLTWSSNPLSNCLAAVQNGLLQRRNGRCMRSVHDWDPSSLHLCADIDTQPLRPRQRQESMYKLSRRIRIIIWLLWALAVLAILWMFAILGLDLAYAADNGVHCPPSTASLKWEIMAPGGCGSNMASLSMSPSSQNPDDYNKYPLLQVFLGLLFISAIQATQSIALHCTELLVNISRDENMWRNAYDNSSRSRKGPKGSLLASDSLKNAVSSWEYIILSIFKSLLHWSVGQALQPSMETEITDDMSTMDPALVNEELAIVGVTFLMVYTRLLLYAVLAILLASFATFLALRKRSGPQPATMGHLQTIADLVDDWTASESGHIYWGDKGESSTSTVRHAGTSYKLKALGQISPNALYAG
ncbi:hypothetical protein BFJ68_g14212 [Fusarium oxysporum]|uniref:Uncharacterized protein n=2 Tax=Fusarium oxysporum TaxID=5507 RepID=A0A420PWJ4_FUSOX|nr:hypothetical protein BFJ67_g16976 [Fusarium oxysporum f. sp. cepae]RKK24353.1 hypothetical protein BFJ65_g2297 [Fusarium oxysporum f. sp. cepae]RKK26540.1 hypothetical protein BFJ66_g17071 [Fusarium oxysporum f. sp. cepae]RKK96888.1 hypothetical protein BFJ68_g14212 [Fusarium oxysporum]